MMDTQRTLTDALKNLNDNHEEPRQRIINKLNKFNLLDTEQNLAIELHNLYCKADHNQACGWLYEQDRGNKIWDDPESLHVKYLTKARDMLEIVPEVEDIYNLFCIFMRK